MRSYTWLFTAFVGLLAAALLFTACNKDDEEPTIDGETMIEFGFNYVVDGEPYDTATIYDINGTAVKFSIANFYVGGITFMAEEGTPTAIEDKYLLVAPDAGMQEVGNVKDGHYHMAKFFIGVDPEANGQSEEDFTSREENDPLSVQFPSMHWNWNSGYKFIRVDGRVDTDGDGTPDEIMSFHLGTNNMLKNLEFVTHKDVEKGSGHYHFEFDLAKLFTEIDLSKDYFTHTGDNMELAAKFRENMGAAFKYKHQ